MESQIAETQLEGYKGRVVDADNTVRVAEQEEGADVATAAITVAGDLSMNFHNDKSGTIPTGIFLNYKPFWIMGAVALVLALVVIGKKNRREDIDL